MRRPRKETEKITRERIVDAAAAIVEAHGVGAATTKRIAAQAGVAEGSLYHHFPDKAELLITIVLERLPSIRDAFGKLEQTPGGPPLPERLSEALAAMIAFYCRAYLVSAGVASDPELLALCRRRFAETGAGPQRAHQKLSAFLQSEQQNGNLKKGIQPDVLASLLIGACTEYASLSHITGLPPGGLGAEDYARATVQTLSPLLAQPSDGSSP